MKDITAPQTRPNSSKRNCFNFLCCRLAKALLACTSETTIKQQPDRPEENRKITRNKHCHAESLPEKER